MYSYNAVKWEGERSNFFRIFYAIQFKEAREIERELENGFLIKFVRNQIENIMIPKIWMFINSFVY
jgi:hypothetical protein